MDAKFEFNVPNLIESNKIFKEKVDELIQNPSYFIENEIEWKKLLRLRDRLKDSNTTNHHVAKFNHFCTKNVDLLYHLPSFKERPHFYWWNHLDLVKKGDMNIRLEKAEVNYNGVGYSIE
ncbi:MAG: hypothetical protein ACQESP_04780 [Candidatus Muiribacteriota bacterium]